MKKTIITSILFMTLLIFSNGLLAQGGPPQPPGDPSEIGGPVGGAAPIGEGIVILLTLGAAYGGMKVYESMKVEEVNHDTPKETQEGQV